MFYSNIIFMFLGKVPNDALWDEIQEQKAKGQYPWTHLSHDQDAEVWIDPAALPADMSRSVNVKSIKGPQKNLGDIILLFYQPPTFE